MFARLSHAIPFALNVLYVQNARLGQRVVVKGDEVWAVSRFKHEFINLTFVKANGRKVRDRILVQLVQVTDDTRSDVR